MLQIEPLVIVSCGRSERLSLTWTKTFTCDIRKALSDPRVQNMSVSHTLDSQESNTSRKHKMSRSECNRQDVRGKCPGVDGSERRLPIGVRVKQWGGGA